MEVGLNGLRRDLDPRPIPVGPPSIAAMVASLPDSDDVALIDRNGAIGYRELRQRVNAGAAGLRTMGLQPGEMIAVSAANTIDLVIAFLSVQRLGAIWVGINTPLAAPEKAAQLADCGVRFFLGDAKAIGQVEAERGRLPDLAVIRTLVGAGSDFAVLIDSYRGQEPDLPLPDPRAPALIGYTSGTTGAPKGVVHSQHSAMTYLNACFHSDEGGQWLRGLRRGLSIPITNPNGMIYGPVAALTGGGSFVAIDRSDSEGVCEWIDRHAIEVVNLTPTTIRDMLYRPELQHFRLTSLKAVAVGGSPPSPDLLDAFRRRFGFEMIADYGQTESPSSMVSSRADRPPPAGSTGKPHPHLRLAIMDPGGQIVAPGEQGELCATSPENGPWAGVYTAMLGYWRKPELTRAAFHQGTWLRTGDMGFMDADGFVTLVGRKKEMILRGGANIYPAEIEHVLRMHEKINDVVVIGVPDDRLGEIVAAYIEVEADVDPSDGLATELRAYCLSRIARYKTPERWFVVDQIPRNALNKPLRDQLIKTPGKEMIQA